MNTSLRLALARTSLPWLAAGCWLLGSQSGARTLQEHAPRAASTASALALSDAPLKPYQLELLDLAFQAGSAIPSYPLIKDRCKVQAQVVAACLELEQFQRALGYIERIENWQRGEAYADLAFLLARRGRSSEVEACLARAEQVARALRVADEDGAAADDETGESDQAWRRDRILVKIARTHALLGNEEQAARFERGVVESESGKVDGVRARSLEGEGLEAQLAELDVILAGSNLDQARTAFEVCAQLYDRFYAEPARRAQVEQRIHAAEPKMPNMLRIELGMELAGFALDHGDAKNALALVEQAKLVSGACTDVPMVARLAGLRWRSGDEQKAHAEAELALELYDGQRAEIVDIYRAGVLRPLAEAFESMGDAKRALEVYRRTLEEGFANPNARPRAEDLAATCLSLARHGCQPDDELMARIYQIFGALKAPW